MERQTLAERLEENGYENIMIIDSDEYDDAFIGISDEYRAIYSFDKMVEALIEHDGMTPPEAIDYIEYNIVRALPYMKGKAPIIVYDLLL